MGNIVQTSKENYTEKKFMHRIYKVAIIQVYLGSKVLKDYQTKVPILAIEESDFKGLLGGLAMQIVESLKGCLEVYKD